MRITDVRAYLLSSPMPGPIRLTSPAEEWGVSSDHVAKWERK